jgi:cytochrome c6
MTPLSSLLRQALSVLLLMVLVLICLWPLPAWGEGGTAVGPLVPGQRLFINHCSGCHINGGNVIRRGKTLRLEALKRHGAADPAVIATIAAAGVGQMAGYAEALGPGGSELVADWVWQQAQAGWPRS